MLRKPPNKSTEHKDIENANLLLEITPTRTERETQFRRLLELKISVKVEIPVEHINPLKNKLFLRIY